MTTLTMRTGEIVSIAGIETIEVGLALLEELDRSIITIEEQIERAHSGSDDGWLIKARTALKYKRRARSPLQERIGQLRREAKAAGIQARVVADTSPKRVWLGAFLDAVREGTPEEAFRAHCRRADEIAASRKTADVVAGADQETAP